ncbi:hypothetical protein [Paenibacillus sp. OSY-SE]|uniref:hypothetical protein n=1 Tax=Paenibacillus sp. OSY-SE TaxID=1196323 RepID=UPI0003633BA5|nr:hypothetical protein [Paenibacillus sp. OSY-SE]
MKKGLIVLGATAILLAGILAPTTGFAAERVGSNNPQINNASTASSFVLLRVGESSYLSWAPKLSVISGHDIVSVDSLGKVYAKKTGTATVGAYEYNGKLIKTYSILVM